MKMGLRDSRVIVLGVLVSLAIILLIKPMILKKSGVVVMFVSDISPCKDFLPEGSVITEIGGRTVENVDDFIGASSGLQGPTTMRVDGNPRICNIKANESLNITVQNLKTKALDFGMDIEGGTRVLLRIPNETEVIRDEARRIIETRTGLYGLKDTRVYTLGNEMIQIEMAGAGRKEIRDFLTKQGRFEAKILEEIKLKNNAGKLKFNSTDYPLEIRDDRVFINNTEYEEVFYLDGIKFEIQNITNNSLVVLATAYTGEDIEAVLTDQQYSGLGYVDGVYQFMFTVQISKEGAERFAKITKDQDVLIDARGEKYLATPLILFLDDNPVSRLNIAADLAGKEIFLPSITGAKEDRSDAIKEKNRLQSILKSGSLPVKPEIVRIDIFSPVLGRDFVNSIFYVILTAIIVVSVVMFTRYKNPKIIVLMIITSLSEIVLILGVASSQFFALSILFLGIGIVVFKGEANSILKWLTIFMMFVMGFSVVIGKWVLDIPSIVGLIAVIGTGFNQMIIITDQIFMEKEGSITKRHDFTLEMVWDSAAIVVAAMLPLFIFGVGMVKGFGVAIIVGTTIGVMITRPLYATILGSMMEE